MNLSRLSLVCLPLRRFTTWVFESKRNARNMLGNYKHYVMQMIYQIWSSQNVYCTPNLAGIFSCGERENVSP
jgi:hypothetical protein